MSNFKICKTVIVAICSLTFIASSTDLNEKYSDFRVETVKNYHLKYQIKYLRVPFSTSGEDFEDRFSLASSDNVTVQSRRDFIKEISAAAIFFSLFPASVLTNTQASPQSLKPDIVPLISNWLTQNVAPNTDVILSFKVPSLIPTNC